MFSSVILDRHARGILNLVTIILSLVLLNVCTNISTSINHDSENNTFGCLGGPPKAYFVFLVS